MIELLKPIGAILLIALVIISLYNEYARTTKQKDRGKIKIIEITLTKDNIQMSKTVKDDDSVDILLSFAVKMAKASNKSEDIIKTTIDEFYKREDI